MSHCAKVAKTSRKPKETGRKMSGHPRIARHKRSVGKRNCTKTKYEGWNFNSGNYLFTTDTK
jgi:hypothetical protein